MAVTINYNVDSIQCYTQYDQYTDVVVKVGWSCIGSGISQVGPQSGSEVKTYYPNTTELTINSGSWDSGSFVPFSQLTNQIVMGWVFGQIGSQKDAIDTYVTNQVEQMINPTIVNLPLPWLPTGSIQPTGSTQP
jgi:hypothetical protein